jgi:hypothetical protein
VEVEGWVKYLERRMAEEEERRGGGGRRKWWPAISSK